MGADGNKNRLVVIISILVSAAVMMTSLLDFESEAKKSKKGKSPSKEVLKCPGGWDEVDSGQCARVNFSYGYVEPVSPYTESSSYVGEYTALAKSYSSVHLKFFVFDKEATLLAAQDMYLSNVYKNEPVAWEVFFENIVKSTTDNYKVTVIDTVDMPKSQITIPEFSCPQGYLKAKMPFCYSIAGWPTLGPGSKNGEYRMEFHLSGDVIPVNDSYQSLAMEVTIYNLDNKASGTGMVYISNAVKGKSTSFDTTVYGHLMGIKRDATFSIRYNDGIELTP